MAMTETDEQELLTAFETSSLKSAATKTELARLKLAAHATLLRNRRMNACPYHRKSVTKNSILNLRLEQRSLESEMQTGKGGKNLLPSNSMPTVFLQTVLTILPVLTAAMYLLGLSWHQGYLSAFGIDDSLFPLANDKALFTGFLSLVTITVSPGWYFVLPFLVFAILVTVVAILASTARVRSMVVEVRAWLVSQKKQPVSPVTDKLLEKNAVVYTYVAGFVFVLVILLFTVSYSSKKGGEQAEREMAAFREGNGASSQIFSPQVQVPLAGKLVICSEKHCAFWSAAGTTILKHEAIDRIVTVKRISSIKSTTVDGPASAAQGSRVR